MPPDAPARRPSAKAARVTDHFRIGRQRIGVEAEDHRRSIEPEQEIDVASGRLPQTGEAVLVADGVVGRREHPPGSGFGAPETKARQRRRGEGLGQDRQAGAAIRRMCLRQSAPQAVTKSAQDFRSPFTVMDYERHLDRRGRAPRPGDARFEAPSVDGCAGLPSTLVEAALRWLSPMSPVALR